MEKNGEVRKGVWFHGSLTLPTAISNYFIHVMRIDNTSGNSSHLKQKEEGKRRVTPSINHVDVDDALHATGTNSPANVFSGNKTGNTGGHRETRQFVRVSTDCVCARLFLGPSRVEQTCTLLLLLLHPSKKNPRPGRISFFTFASNSRSNCL